jgi:hypothetical protein
MWVFDRYLITRIMVLYRGEEEPVEELMIEDADTQRQYIVHLPDSTEEINGANIITDYDGYFTEEGDYIYVV